MSLKKFGRVLVKNPLMLFQMVVPSSGRVFVKNVFTEPHRLEKNPGIVFVKNGVMLLFQTFDAHVGSV
ncbi:MAG TPA: hypothetical protein DC001_02755, partial [Clostridiales bacterium]|nr:hypothetical protein [Clostridiales bacterium]